MDAIAESAKAFIDEATCRAAREPEPWGEPDLSLLRQETISAPLIPEDVLPPFWARWTADAAEGASSPQAFVAVALLAAVGGIIGNARWASPWDAWKEPPALFVALVGRPSSGKSPAMDQIQDLLTRLEAELNTDWPERQRDAKGAKLEAAERLKRYESEVKKAVESGLPRPTLPAGCDEPKPVQRHRICTTDTTVEKAVRLNEPNPRGMILMRDELAGWITGMDRYSGSSGGDRPFWLQAYGGRTWTTDRVKDGVEPVHVPHLLWSICGGIQPDKVARLMMGGDDDGLTSRFLYVWPDPIPPRRPQSNVDNEGALDALRRLRSLSWRGPEPIVLPFASSSLDIFHKWRKQVAHMETETDGLMLSWIGKLPGLAVRIGLILEMLRWCAAPDGTPEPQMISERAVIDAITFLRDFALPMARRTFGTAALPQAEQDARRLARWLLRQSPLPAMVNAKELRRVAQGPEISDAERMENALRELEAACWVRPAPSRAAGYGRQRKDYAVNPALAVTQS